MNSRKIWTASSRVGVTTMARGPLATAAAVVLILVEVVEVEEEEEDKEEDEEDKEDEEDEEEAEVAVSDGTFFAFRAALPAPRRFFFLPLAFGFFNTDNKRGRRNAHVFPDPVGATARTSRPSAMQGIACI